LYIDKWDGKSKSFFIMNPENSSYQKSVQINTRERIITRKPERPENFLPAII